MPDNIDPDSKQGLVFEVLRDQEWHCREHEYEHIGSRQIAGGGGLQGLKRKGLVLERERSYCAVCETNTIHDRWTGAVQAAQATGNVPSALARRVRTLYGFRNPFTGTRLREHELTVDHRVPRIRWGGGYVPPQSSTISDADIRRHFQLLKNTSGHNDNLLKSRACERCLAKGERQSPIPDIEFFYEGGKRWPSHLDPTGADAEEGCRGCGWYDVLRWAQAVNERLG